MRRLLMALTMAVLAAYLWSDRAFGEVTGNPSISSTSTSATVSIGRAVRDLTLINDSASANETYLRVFWCGEVTSAAVAATAPAFRLEPGESITFTFGPSDGGDGGYCAFSHVTAAAETATLRMVAK